MNYTPGTLVTLTKSVFMWMGDDVHRGDISHVENGLSGVVVNKSNYEEFKEHCKVQFETGVIGYVPARWLVKI
mgnify:CR=1 FL=1